MDFEEFYSIYSLSECFKIVKSKDKFQQQIYEYALEKLLLNIDLLDSKTQKIVKNKAKLLNK